MFLKALGNKHYSDMTLIRSYAIELQESPLKKFLTQLFVLLEDLRVEEIVKNLRPGTKHVFKEEKKCIAITLAHKMKSIALRNYHGDRLFCLCYLSLTSDKYEMFNNEYFEQIEAILHETFQARNTEDIMYIVEKIRYRLEELLESDMLNNYFGHAPLYLSVIADEKTVASKI